MSDEIRVGTGEKRKPRKPAPADDAQGTPSIAKQPGSPWLLLVAGGALLTCVLLSVGAGIAGLAFLLHDNRQIEIAEIERIKADARIRADEAPEFKVGVEQLPPPKEEDKKIEIGQLPPPQKKPKQVEVEQPAPAKEEPMVVGKTPWGDANVNELDAEIAIWDYAIRLPKNCETLMGNVKIAPEISHYKWRLKGRMDHIDVSKARAQGFDPLTLYKNDPIKSGPKELVPFELIRLPQEVHINSLRGARQWRWSTSPPAPGHMITVSYRFEVDGWHYAFNASAVGDTREEAEKTASLMDVSLCTFRKR